MNRIISFAGVTFPDTGRFYDDNFADLVTRTTRMPGMSGGIDEFGYGEAPSEIGNVRYDFWLTAASRAEMQGLLNTYRGLASKGRSILRMQPVDTAASERFTWARISDISTSMDARRADDTHLLVTINWQVPGARWYGTGTEGSALWGSATWGTSTWGAARTVVSAGTNDFTRTNAGNATAYPRIIIDVGAGTSISGITIQRLSGGLPVETLTYTQTLTTSQVLSMNARTKDVRIDGVDAYADITYDTPHWISIPPGVHTIRISTAAGSSTGFLVLSHYDTYY